MKPGTEAVSETSVLAKKFLLEGEILRKQGTFPVVFGCRLGDPANRRQACTEGIQVKSAFDYFAELPE